MDFQGPKIKLSDTDLPRIGNEIGVGEDEIHAFLEVETRGSGFDSLGRPCMMFEPHYFYRLLGKGAKQDAAVKAGLAYPKQGMQPYPKESYTRLAAAMKIDQELALQSASWGIGQLMGANFVAAGYASAYDMVGLFVDKGEPEMLQACVDFIKHNHLDDELRTHNWASFARGYNGSGYARNAYDAKLKAAFEKWSKIPDTKWSPADTMRVAMNAKVEDLALPPVVTPVAPPKVAPALPTLPPPKYTGKHPFGNWLATKLGLPWA